jgi:hypothetical protein
VLSERIIKRWERKGETMIAYKEVTPEEIATAWTKIKKIRKTTNPNIDRRMLWCAVNLMFLAGVKEREIQWFKVKNVCAAGNIVDRITVCWKSIIKPIPLSDTVKKILRNYIRYRQANKPEIDPDSPLFPAYFGRNAKGTLAADLEEFSLKISQLRRIGAGNHYWTLIRNGINQGTAQKETMTQFRISEDGALEGRPRPIYEAPKKSVIREKERKERKEKEKDERAEEQGPPEIKVRINEASKRNAKKREKVIKEGSPLPSAWSFDGRIEKVGNDYIDMRSMGRETRKTFIIEETTQNFETKQVISLGDLKKGMEVRVRYEFKNLEMVAKWIKVL